jgi:hypothetical protein
LATYSYETELVGSLPQEYHCILDPDRENDALNPVENFAVWEPSPAT